jgi:UDP:flavonoid glycosyltransferase YjiC (YdhE family)
MAQITLVVFGSLGDLHPMLGVGLARKQQGASITVDTP